MVAAGLLAVLAQAGGQPNPAIDQRVQTADAELNAVYRELITTLPPADRNRLRVAERAWVTFKQKNEAAFSTLAAKEKIPPSRLVSARAAELEARRDTLRMLLNSGSDVSRFQISQQLSQADSDLNAAYRDCLAILDKSDTEMLRDAQRAWIDFRDAQAQTRNGLATSLMVMNRRTAQLREFYLGAAPTPMSQQASREPQPLTQYPDRIIPDPFERAR